MVDSSNGPFDGRPFRGVLAEIRGADGRRDRALVSAALAHLLPSVGEDAYASAEHEQAARERGGKTELGIDDGGRAVDVHRDRAVPSFVESGFDGPCRPGGLAVDDTGAHGVVDGGEQGGGAGGGGGGARCETRAGGGFAFGPGE